MSIPSPSPNPVHALNERSAFSRLLPQTLFGRLFLVMSLISATVAILTGGLLASQAVELLDQQASRRMSAGARLMADELKNYSGTDPQGFTEELFERVFGSGQGLGWIRNTYWVDLREGRPLLMALLSLPATDSATLLSPSLEDIEDLLDDALSDLEEGRPFFPNPQLPGGARRYKIVLHPLLDAEGLLTGIIGLEADFQYLDLRRQMKSVLWATIAAGLLISIIASWLLAGSVSRRVDKLLDDLDAVGRRASPDARPLGIREFDRLRSGLQRLGAAIAAGDQRLHRVYEEKRAELSLTGAAIAHEIRNPLAAMELHLGLLKRRLASTSPGATGAEEFREIESEMAAMKHLTDRFLDYSRKVTPNRQSLELGPWIGDLIAGLTKRFPQARIESEIPHGLMVSLDPAMGRQIVENLTCNAVQSRPEGLTLRIRGTVNDDQSDRRIILTFTDNGPGVPEDLVPRLFSPFAGARPGGNGIGLALTRKLLEAHHGTISYRPVPAGGAEFIIEVPGNA